MGLAPSNNGDFPAFFGCREVPVPIFSQPLREGRSFAERKTTLTSICNLRLEQDRRLHHEITSNYSSPNLGTRPFRERFRSPNHPGEVPRGARPRRKSPPRNAASTAAVRTAARMLRSRFGMYATNRSDQGTRERENGCATFLVACRHSLCWQVLPAGHHRIRVGRRHVAEWSFDASIDLPRKPASWSYAARRSDGAISSNGTHTAEDICTLPI